MITSAARDALLSTFDGHFVGWLEAISNFRTGAVTEMSYAGYARAAVTFGTPTDTTPVGGRQRSNSAIATGGTKTDSGAATAIAWGIFAASSGGNPKWMGMLDSDSPIVGAIEDATNDRIIAKSHGFSVDQRIFVLAAPGAEIPTGLSENVAYYVGTVTDADRFTLSTTAANANPVAITARGAAQFLAYTPLSVTQNATPEFDIGAIVIQI